MGRRVEGNGSTPPCLDVFKISKGEGSNYHGFKNRTGHRTVFLKISGSTPVFDRFLADFPVVDRF